MTIAFDHALPETLGQVPSTAARCWPDAEALIDVDGKTWTYSKLSEEVDRVAKALIASGVKPKDRVALWVTNKAEFLFSFFAILRIGAIAVPLNTRWRTRDLSFALRHSEASALISETVAGPIDFREMVLKAISRDEADDCEQIEDYRGLRTAVFLPPYTGGVHWDDFLANGEAIPASQIDSYAGAVSPDDMALLIYTSGTTGEPKGVMLSHIGVQFSFERAKALGMTSKDVQLNYLPLFHIYSLIYAVLPTFLTGAKQVLMQRFDAHDALRLVTETGVTMLHGFDTHYKDLLSAFRSKRESYDMKTLRWGTFAAGTEAARSTAMEVQNFLCRTISTYGQTETWGSITAGPVGCTVDQSCVASGFPLPGVELRIVDPVTKLDVERGHVGEILVRSKSVMLGYYKADSETSGVVDGDGWVHTGDAGSMRSDGHLRYAGRFKDMLKVGGENVDPAEVESLLLESPLIDKVAVVGCPDERLSEVVAAFVVPVQGSDFVQVKAQIDELCKGAIASFKIPKVVEFLSEMPINAAGKIDKKILRAQLANRDAAQVQSS